MHSLSILVVLTAALTLVACSSPPVMPAPSSAARPTAVTAGPAAAATSLPGSTAVTGDGRTDTGQYYLGRPDAPVTIEEWGDFQ